MPTDLRAKTGLAYDDLLPTDRPDGSPLAATRPVVLVHAGICDRRMWNPQIGALSAGRRIVRLDLRGYGSSDRKPASTLSHHLDKLRNEGLVNVKRESTFLRYTANIEALQDVLQFLYAECCTRNNAVKPQAIIQLCK